MKKTFIIQSILIIISALFVFKMQTFAQTPSHSLSIEPAVVDIQLHQGQQYVLSYTLKNTSDLPVGVHVSLEGFDAADERNDITILPNQSLLSKWATVPKTDTILPQHSQTALTLTLSVPENAEEKGYYGIVFFQTYIATPLNPNIPQVTSRLGSLLLVTVGKQDLAQAVKKTSIPTFSLQYVNGSHAQVSLEVENSYLTHFSAKPILKIKGIGGQEKQFILSDKTVLPGKIRLWDEDIPLPRSTFPFYSVHLSLSIGQGHVITKSIWFVNLPLNLVIGIIVLVFCFGILFLIQKRLTKAFHILLSQ